jgi:hypothetical protein
MQVSLFTRPRLLAMAIAISVLLLQVLPGCTTRSNFLAARLARCASAKAKKCSARSAAWQPGQHGKAKVYLRLANLRSGATPCPRTRL